MMNMIQNIWLEKSPDACALANKKGEIIFVNKSLLKIFGYREKELIGKKIDVLFSKKNLRSEFLEILNNQEIKKIESLGKRKNNSEFSIEVYSISHEETHLFVIRDSTNQKEIEDKVNKLSKIVDQNPSIIIVTDENGSIEYVNRRFTEVTGYSLKDVYGKTPRVLKSGHTSPETYDSLWKTILSGQKWSGEFHNKKKNGEFYWGKALIAPITDSEGRVTNFVGMQEDITGKKNVEEDLKKQLDELKEFQTITINREIRMIELKEEVNSMLMELNKKPKYHLK